MTVIDQLSLRRDPFGPACAETGFGVAASVLVARERLMAAIRRGDPLTVLAGRPGMGKTLLLAMIEQACRADGINVRTVARGDMAHTALGSDPELLLIDEADTINAATLKALAPGTAEAAAATMVFAAAQPALHRISSDVRTTIVDLRPLDPAEARDFLLSRAAQAGRVNLFTPEALDIIVDAGRGSPRLLRVLAGAAMFQAVSDGIAQVMPEHASLAAAMQGSLFGRPAAEPQLPVPANDLGPRVDVEDRPRRLLAPLARPMARESAAALAVAASVALVALVLPVFSLPDPAAVPSMAVSTASAAQAAPGAARAAAFTVAPMNAAALVVPGRSAAPEAAIRHASLTVPPLLAAPAPRILVAALDAGIPPIRPLEARIAAAVAEVARTETRAAIGADRAMLIDVLAATRLRPAVASRTSDGIQEPAGMSETLAADAPVAPDLPRSPVFAMTEQGGFWRAAVTASEAAPSAMNVAAEPVSFATLTRAPIAATTEAASGSGSARGSSIEAAQVAFVAKQAADETRATKLAAEQAKGAAAEAKAAKEAADQAKEAKEAAEQSKAAKDAADHSKSAKEAAEQAKAAKRAADQAKEIAEQAKAAKDAADQAKAAKEAAEQAKAAKDAADQAKAAKEAADQAKAAKDAADQAKAAKDAADQAKAAKDAADVAKEAAKAAAEIAKAAKEAVKAGKGT